MGNLVYWDCFLEGALLPTDFVGYNKTVELKTIQPPPEGKNMQYINLGKSGLKVSRICLGMMSYGTSKWRDWVLDEEDSRPFIQRALELGINFFDTADMYSLGGSEEVTGWALKDFAPRDEVIIATKVYHHDEPSGQRPGPLAQAYHRLRGEITQASAHRLYRSLPDPPLGLRDSDRGDAGSPSRPGALW